MSDATTVTIAEETITTAMLAALIACAAANYILITQLGINTIPGYIILTIASFVTFAYLVPNLTAFWLGRPLDDIFDPDTNTIEDTIDTNPNDSRE